LGGLNFNPTNQPTNGKSRSMTLWKGISKRIHESDHTGCKCNQNKGNNNSISIEGIV
jgi:hypothetical protein